MSGLYKSVDANGRVSYSDQKTDGAVEVKGAPPPPHAGTKPNHTGGSVYTKVMVEGREVTMEYGKAREYQEGLREQAIQAKERAKREIEEARNSAQNFQNANQARDKFYAASDRLTNAQHALWESVMDANRELGFQDSLQDGFTAALSAIGLFLAITGTGGAALVVTLTAADWGNSALRSHQSNQNDALDLAAKANDVAGALPGQARVLAKVATTAAGVFTDGKEIADSKPDGISLDVYSPESRQNIRNSINWSKDAKGNYVKGPYQERWGVGQERINKALDEAEAAQKDFDEARAAYEIAERRRFSRASWSQPK